MPRGYKDGKPLTEVSRPFNVRRIPDLSGQVFQGWTVLREDGRDATGQLCWLCRCHCGAEVRVRHWPLTRGRSKECALHNSYLNGKGRYIHGHAAVQTGEYQSWRSMWQRVRGAMKGSNPRYKAYRGVTICDRWKSFEAFFADMGWRMPGTSLDRINPFGNYEVSNCRWATKTEQENNKRRNWLDKNKPSWDTGIRSQA